MPELQAAVICTTDEEETDGSWAGRVAKLDIDVGFYFQRLGVFQRDYDRHHNKYINMRKGSISETNVVQAASVLFQLLNFL